MIPSTKNGSSVTQLSFLWGSKISLELLLFPNQIAFVFSMLTLRPEHSAYNSSVFKQCCNELSDPSRVKNVSLAYWPIRNSVSLVFIPLTFVLAFIPSASSSTYIKNKYGDSGSPCLTPLSIRKNVDR